MNPLFFILMLAEWCWSKSGRLLIACCLLFCVGCAHVAKHAAITSGARTSVAQAQAATNEAQRASERSSTHIREFRSDAERIDFKAGRALEILDHP